MNVLLVTSGYPPEHSGSGLRLHETYVRLVRRHPELRWRVLTRRRATDPTPAQPLGPDAVDTFPAPLTGHLAYAPVQAALEWRELRRRLRAGLLADINLVHSAGFTWLSVFLCREAKRRRIPVVRELTSTADAGTGRGLGGRAFAAVIRSLNRAADLLITISPGLEREVAASGVDRPMWCRPNPVDTARFRPPDAAERESARSALLRDAGWPDDVVVVLHVGHIRPNKNQLLLAEAIRGLPARFRLVLVGPAYDDDRTYLRTIEGAVADAGIERRVRIEPEFRTDIERYMAAADVFVFPSKREGLGNVMLEALCTGLPVAATNLPGVTDWIIEPGENGFLFELTAEEVAARIMDAERLRHRRDEIARAAAERFDSDAIDGGYWERLQTLVLDEIHELPTRTDSR